MAGEQAGQAPTVDQLPFTGFPLMLQLALAGMAFGAGIALRRLGRR